MIKLAIPEAALALHSNLYRQPIQDVLDAIAQNDPIYKFAKDDGHNHGRKRIDEGLKRDGIGRKYIGEVSEYHRANDLMRAKPDVMASLCAACDGMFDESRMNDADKEDFERAKEILLWVFNYDAFRDGRMLVKKTHESYGYYSWVNNVDVWGGWKFLEALGVKTCCYCNAETVFALLLRKKKPGEDKIRHTADDYKKSALDHFFGHEEYPFLGISLYNLIPACTRCNTNFKNAKRMAFGSITHPYCDDFHDAVKFMPLIQDSSAFYSGASEEVEVRLERRHSEPTWDNDTDKANAFSDFFHLEDVYNQLYRDDIADTLRRARLLPKDYVSALKKNYPGIQQSVLDRIEWGVSLKPEDINKHVLSKLTIDIVSFCRKGK